jgi:Fe2+ or Zn2+ uptake regulation protein
MNTTSDILESIRKQGKRITSTRRLVVEIMVAAATPLSVQELLSGFTAKRSPVNKTTLYRELDFLEELGIVHQVQLGQDRKRYELTAGPHHHHIRCVKCDRIEDIDFPDHLESTITHIEKKTGFTVLDHSLEFVGLCKKHRS